MHQPQLSIIITTYNKPLWLEKVLIGYTCQTSTNFEIIIANDGSTNETKDLIDTFSNKLNIHHVWHEDIGFRKTIILNKAILVSKTPYLLFTDDDCIPRADFVATHLKYRKKRIFFIRRLF